jgi:hypothetical protein
MESKCSPSTDRRFDLDQSLMCDIEQSAGSALTDTYISREREEAATENPSMPRLQAVGKNET